MTGLLTFAAVITTMVLIVSAVRSGATATASDPNPRGPWGIAHWTRNRERPLNPHERRWQTSLLSGKDNPSRWPDLVAEISELRRLGGLPPRDPPTEYDARWLDARVTELEKMIDDSSPQPSSGVSPQ